VGVGYGQRPDSPPLGTAEKCSTPTLVGALLGVKVDAVLAGYYHTLALVDDGSVYA
jgi:alpha-tubulin suppressor-like RCC1 family protein